MQLSWHRGNTEGFTTLSTDAVRARKKNGNLLAKIAASPTEKLIGFSCCIRTDKLGLHRLPTRAETKS